MNMVLSRIVRRWVAGETIDDVIKAAVIANQKGMKALLNKLGEHTKERRKVNETVKDYLKILTKIRNNRLNASLSVKLTQLGIDIGNQYCFGNLRKIVNSAGGILVWIDMESSEHTQETIDMHNKLSGITKISE